MGGIWFVLAWLGVVLPLISVAVSLMAIARTQTERNQFERYQRFQKIMFDLGRTDGSSADKIAAAYELRHYSDYAEVISKVFGEGYQRDDTGELLQSQISATLEQIRAR